MEKKYLEPELLFRYIGKVTKISTAGEASTVTFLTEEQYPKSQVEHWAFFDAGIHNEILRKAIVSDVKVGLLIGRYMRDIGEGETKGKVTKIEDRVLEVCLVYGK